jgi:hypothetical protein
MCCSLQLAECPNVFGMHFALLSMRRRLTPGSGLHQVVPRTVVVAHPEADERAVRFFTMQDDVVKDEGPYEGSAVIREGSLMMARTPVDLPAFCRMIIAALAEPPPPTVAH